MKIGILRETKDKRIALIPDTIRKVKKELGVDILMEQGAGVAASFPDVTYEENTQILSRGDVLAQADMICSVHPLEEDELAQMQKECW